ncbi:MAG: asparaginase [Burkholderiales bacterium]
MTVVASPRIDPVLVEAWRGDAPENAHRGAYAVVDASGAIIEEQGDTERAVFPRSAVKPLQALPLIDTGAAARYGLGAAGIALACASHSGEPGHVDAVAALLDKGGLAPTCLECGAQVPMGEAAASALCASGKPPTPLHNNCSGKHAGFLLTARHQGEALEGYVEEGHPVQRRVAQALAEAMQHELGAAPRGRDGCGIPTFAVPLHAVARGMASLAPAARGLPARRRAAEQLRDAVMAHPWLVAGSGRFDTEAMLAGAGTVLVKMGADGVHAACIPALGLGIASKIADGSPRASEVLMASLLARHARPAPALAALLGRRARREIVNNRGEIVGGLRCSVLPD